MDDRTRREERREKRTVKRLGSQRVRRLLKRSLADNPDEAPHDAVDYGRLSSTPWNGLDRKPTPPARTPIVPVDDDDA